MCCNVFIIYELSSARQYHSSATFETKSSYCRVARQSLPCYTAVSHNQLQKYLRHCTVFWHKWPVHDLVLVIPPPPLIKVASNTRPYSGTTLNGREEGGQYYILQTCDQARFEARKVVFPWECLIIFVTGCSDHALSLYLCNLFSGHAKKVESGLFSDWIKNNSDDLRCSNRPKRRHPLLLISVCIFACVISSEYTREFVMKFLPAQFS